MTKPVVVVTRSWTKTVQAAIAQRFDTRLNRSDRIMSAEEIVEQCQGATVLSRIGTDSDREDETGIQAGEEDETAAYESLCSQFLVHCFQ